MIAIIDYKAGNAKSVQHAIRRIGFDACLTNAPDDILKAKSIILPGVGSAGATMDSLRELRLIDSLKEAVINNKTRFLGICVGMQILFEHSQEDDADCFGWLKGTVVKFNSNAVRVPQMGWNMVSFAKNSQLQALDDFYYFVNSYYVKPADEKVIWGRANYGGSFCAAVLKDNIYAAQFHVEKSGESGLMLLKSFLSQTEESGHAN